MPANLSTRRLSENLCLQAAQKASGTRRAKFDELRRTLQYVEARRASATKYMRPFQQPDKEEISQLIWIRLAGIVDR